MSLFPLSAVLFPGGRMPLQIFEQRYLDLVRDSMKAQEPFGLVWIRRGSEVSSQGRAAPQLGDVGCSARIVDWDQLPNGLLGITIAGEQRFELLDTETRANGLVVGEVEMLPDPVPVPTPGEFDRVTQVLRSLEAHPHVQRLHLDVDYSDAWQVGYALAQLLPLEEAVKYELLELEGPHELLRELDMILNQLSGEDQVPG